MARIMMSLNRVWCLTPTPPVSLKRMVCINGHICFDIGHAYAYEGSEVA